MQSLLRMRVIVFLLTAVIALSLTGISDWALAQDDLNQDASCQHCGMSRVKFAHSRVLVKYEDGSTFAACSLRCAAEDLAQKKNKAPEKILVGDYNSKKLIDAERGYWVVGGSKRGVMTAKAKWAFQSKEEANKFIQKYGGQLSTFDYCMGASLEEVSYANKMGHKKGHMKKMKHK